MMIKSIGYVAIVVLGGFLGEVAGPGVACAHAADLSLKAQLVWGTDGAKPKDPRLKELDPKLKHSLHRVFKWKHYWEVSRKSVQVHPHAVRRVRMSDKCELVIKNLGNSNVDVKLYGEGRYVKKVTQPLHPGEYLVLAGDDKDNNAWFVVLSP
jgi:hypothetical protein